MDGEWATEVIDGLLSGDPASEAYAWCAIGHRAGSDIKRVMARSGVAFDHAVLEDLTQEVIVRIWRYSRLKILQASGLKALIRLIATRVVIEYLRRPRAVTGIDLAERHMARPRQLGAFDVNEAIARLPLEERVIIEMLVATCGRMTFKELARLLRVSVRTIERRLRSAQGSLRDRLQLE